MREKEQIGALGELVIHLGDRLTIGDYLAQINVKSNNGDNWS
ncbi:hypothetical protein RU98_GL001959 [Enterococcus caccae]|nr:hypothetical protein RU98_GL001959 [Enterococcus caccae]